MKIHKQGKDGGEETNILTSFRNFCPDRSRTIRHSMGAKLGNFYQIEFLPNSHVVSDAKKSVGDDDDMAAFVMQMPPK